MIQPTLPVGFRDTSPNACWHKKYIIETLEKQFVRCGFLPLETPAFEKLTTLLGKYGNEGEQLIFKVVNSGHLPEQSQTNKTPIKTTKGLRYDLTVPLARYIAQHKNTITFPFKRYQIQPVWRAERPQKGRYREFYQCDIDVVGSASLFHEASLLVLVYKTLNALGIKDFTILLNHRQMLSSITDYLGMTGQENVVCQTLDKLDKIGIPAVIDILTQKGLSTSGESRLRELLVAQGTYQAQHAYLAKQLSNPSAQHALGDISNIVDYIAMLYPAALAAIKLTPTLARGMSYYTGAIFEVKANKSIGSIVGGGRYDGLTTMFGLKDVAGVGLSFGLARIYDIMKAHDLFPSQLPTTQILVVPMDKTTEKHAIDLLNRLRTKGFITDFYPYGPRAKKILTYAHKRQIPWVAMIGEKEASSHGISLKDMQTGQQKLCTFVSLVQAVSVKQ